MRVKNSRTFCLNKVLGHQKLIKKLKQIKVVKRNKNNNCYYIYNANPAKTFNLNV